MSSIAAAVSALASLVSGECWAVVGLPGTGKTHAAQVALREWRKSFARIVIFDPYADRDRANPQAHPWAGDLVTSAALFAAPERLDRRALLVVSPDTLDARAMGRRFAAVADLCWYTGGVCLVAEEAALYGREAAGAVLRVATGGRHAGMGLVLLSQAIGRIPIDGRRCLAGIVAGTQSEPADVQALRDRTELTAPGWADKVATLRKGDPLAVWRVGVGAPSEKTS